jgi:FixJ family two-component response regulator
LCASRTCNHWFVTEVQSFAVRTANRPADFMDSFKKFSPGAIILDLFMPEIDGIELLRWLAGEGCQARISILSGFDGQMLEPARHLGEARGLKIVDTLSKPIRLATLREALKRLGQAP